jgi:GNAT superfamily N-acetyltransferase
MAVPVQIQPLIALPEGFQRLRRAADAEGFAFVGRLESEWRAGVNRFDGAGECLLGALISDDLVAIGGLNRDPYAGDRQIGRLRRVYVLPAFRGSGVGRALVTALLARATGVFRCVRLRTETPAAAAFYERCGFRPARGGEDTHSLELR